MGDIHHQRHIFRKKTIQRISRRKTLSNRVLTDTLKFMEDNDLITKQVFENDIKTEYSLTQKRIESKQNFI